MITCWVRHNARHPHQAPTIREVWGATNKTHKTPSRRAKKKKRRNPHIHIPPESKNRKNYYVERTLWKKFPYSENASEAIHPAAARAIVSLAPAAAAAPAPAAASSFSSLFPLSPSCCPRLAPIIVSETNHTTTLRILYRVVPWFLHSWLIIWLFVTDQNMRRTLRRLVFANTPALPCHQLLCFFGDCFLLLDDMMIYHPAGSINSSPLAVVVQQ